MWDKSSPEEMARRWTLARHLMEDHDLQALILFGNSGVNRHNEANVFWRTNHLDLHHCYLVAPRDPNQAAAPLTGLTNHVPNARQVSDIPLITWGGCDPAEAVADRRAALKVESGRVGLLGVNHKFGMGMPYQHYQRLRGLHPKLAPVDVTADFARLRQVKSTEKLDTLRRAAEFTVQAILALREQIRSGIPEHALSGIIEGDYQSQEGCRTSPSCDRCRWTRPTVVCRRRIRRAEGLRRGTTSSPRSALTAGAIPAESTGRSSSRRVPTPPWQALFDAALSAYQNMAQAIRPGATEADVIQAASVLGERGYAIYDDLIHGYGVDIHPPLIDRSCAQYWPWDPDNPAPRGSAFEENMAIVLQPNPITPDERMGLQLGALTVVTADGAQSMHDIPFEPLVVS